MIFFDVAEPQVRKIYQSVLGSSINTAGGTVVGGWTIKEGGDDPSEKMLELLDMYLIPIRHE